MLDTSLGANEKGELLKTIDDVLARCDDETKSRIDFLIENSSLSDEQKASIRDKLDFFIRETKTSNRTCCIKAEELQRPTLHCEELPQEEGGCKIGRQCWGAVFFKASIDTFDHCGNFYKVTLQTSQESWGFYDAKIALNPSTDRESFVMVYDRCELISNMKEKA